MLVVPQIDISPFLGADETRREHVVKQWADAFESVGFATIVGHNVPEGLIEDLHAEALRFFDLPLDEKQLCNLKGEASTLGYTALGGTNLARTLDPGAGQAPGDYNERISFNYIDWERTGPSNEFDKSIFKPNPWPANPPRLRSLVEAYFDQVSVLTRTAMRIGARALDLPEDYFAPHYARMTTQLQLVHYPHQDPAPLAGQLRSGAHVDYLGFTILRQDRAEGGLEVASPNGTWIPVTPTPGSFVINAGEALKRWTNGRWKSNVHRVVNPGTTPGVGSGRNASASSPGGPGENHRRLSIVMFTGPNHDTMLECLPTCDPMNAAPAISAYNHLMEKLRASHANDADFGHNA